MPITIKLVTNSQQNADAQQLFTAYSKALGADLTFQQFDTELQHPLQYYTNANGCILLAYANEEQPAIGCIAVKGLSNHTAEMKRMYVQPNYRSQGIGQLLINAFMQQAKALGYTTVVLDTLQQLTAAIKLYEKNGFTPTTAYYHNPLEDVVYMKRDI